MYYPVVFNLSLVVLYYYMFQTNNEHNMSSLLIWYKTTLIVHLMMRRYCMLHTYCILYTDQKHTICQAYVRRDRAILDRGAYAHYCLVSWISRLIPIPPPWHIWIYHVAISAWVDTVGDDASSWEMNSCCFLPSAHPLPLIFLHRLRFRKIRYGNDSLRMSCITLLRRTGSITPRPCILSRISLATAS